MLRSVGSMKRTMGGIMVSVSALVWSLLMAFVSGRVSGTLHGVIRVSEGDADKNLAPQGTMQASPLPPVDGGNASGALWMNALLIVIAASLALAIVVLLLMIRRVHLRRCNSLLPETRWRTGMKSSLPFVTACPFLKRAELEAACEDFSNIIGTSPDGVLYKGTLADGTEVAVTSIRMSASDWSPNSELSFRRKVEGLTRMNHKHLVNLVGYCTEEEPFTRMLVFDYASNGTLSDHLHHPKEMEHLDWATRMRVVMGAAYGLEYMHHDLTPPCSHLNFDANAIYLTDEYAAKIANFGIARMMPEESYSFDSANRCTSWMGCKVSAGYADEWDAISDRHCPGFESNVYDFGVFLLQTISGRPPYLATDKRASLVNWAQEYLQDPKQLAQMVDPELQAHNSDDLAALCQIAELCLSSKEYKRPSMRKVTQMLAEALKMTPEAATMKTSPLLWAQLSILDDTA